MSSTPNDPPPPPPPASEVPPPPPPPVTGPPPGGPMSSDRKLMLILSYLAILCVIPLFAERNDPEIQWHARNGLAIFLAAFLGGLVFGTVGNFVFGDSGCLRGCALPCAYGLAVMAVSIAGMAKALAGERLHIPFISDFADRF